MTRLTLLVLICTSSGVDVHEPRDKVPSCREDVIENGEPAKSILMRASSLHRNNAEEHLQAQLANFTAKMDAFLEAESQKLRIFCFVWTPRFKGDEQIIPYVRRLLSGCDGHAFFTDTEAPGDDSAGDFVRVQVPQMRVGRHEDEWMKNKNMAGLAPAWDYMFKTGVPSSYDWAINLELDHFAPAHRIRRSILDYLDVLRTGTDEEKRSIDGPLLFAWGNAFLFNSQFMVAMEKKWPELAQPISDDKNPGQGCPMMMLSRATELGACQQDMTYPIIPDILMVPKMYGMSGCNSVPEHAPIFPLSCWQPPPTVEDNMLAIVREVSSMQRFATLGEARSYCETCGSNVRDVCDLLYRARNVPVMHLFKSEGMHKLGAELFLQ